MVNLDSLKAAYTDKHFDTTHPTAAAEQTPATSTPTVPLSRHTRALSSAPSTSTSNSLSLTTTSDVQKICSGRHVHWPKIVTRG